MDLTFPEYAFDQSSPLVTNDIRNMEPAAASLPPQGAESDLSDQQQGSEGDGLAA